MSFTLQEYAARRPYLYHVFSKRNLAAVRRTRVLYSALHLAELAQRPNASLDRRRQSIPLQVSFGAALLRDQSPLHMGNVAFEGDWDAARLLRELASHVFFWPGSELEPIDYGRRHFRKYAATDLVLRVPFAAVASHEPRFCRFNSGSPRCSGGRKSPRGPTTFVEASLCSFGAAEVVEVVFPKTLPLPEETTWSRAFGGPWRPLH